MPPEYMRMLRLRAVWPNCVARLRTDFDHNNVASIRKYWEECAFWTPSQKDSTGRFNCAVG